MRSRRFIVLALLPAAVLLLASCKTATPPPPADVDPPRVVIERVTTAVDETGAFAVLTDGSLVSVVPGFLPVGTPVEVIASEVEEGRFREGVEAVGDRITVSVPASALAGGTASGSASPLRPADLTLNEECDTANDCLFVSLSIDRSLAVAEIVVEVTFNVVRDVAGATQQYLGSQSVLLPAVLLPSAEVRYGVRIGKSFRDRIAEAIVQLESIPPNVNDKFTIDYVPALIRTTDRTSNGTAEGLYRIGDGFTMGDFDAACARPAQEQIPSSVSEVTSPTAIGTRRPLVLVHGWTQILDKIAVITSGLDRAPAVEVFRDLARAGSALVNEDYPFVARSQSLAPPSRRSLFPQLCAWKEFLGEYFSPEGNELRDAFELYSFGYDSRQSIGSNAAQFRSALELAFDGGDAPLVVAHSTGGLLTHAAMVNGADVAQLVTLGSPILGAQTVTCTETGPLPPGEPGEFYREGVRCTNASVNPLIANALADSLSQAYAAYDDELGIVGDLHGISARSIPVLAVAIVNGLQYAAFNDAGTQDLTWFEPIAYEVNELVGHTCSRNLLTGSTPGCGPVFATRTRTTGLANPFTQGILNQSAYGAFEPDRIVAFVGDRLPAQEPLRSSDIATRINTVFYNVIAHLFQALPASVDSDGFVTVDSAGFQPGGGRAEIPAANRRVRDGFTHSQLAGTENFAAIREVLLDAVDVVVEVRPGEQVIVDLRLTLPDPTAGGLGADVMFLFDRSGSFSDDLSTFRAQATNIVNALSDSMDDLRVGLSSFVDAPCAGYGGPSDFGYELNLALTSNVSAFGSILSTLNIRSGADGPESQLEAMRQAMTGVGFDAVAELPPGSACATSSVSISPSSPGWSPARVKFLLVSTDASFHDGNEAGYPYPATAASVIDIAVASGTRVIFLNSGAIDARAVQIAEATGGAVFNLGSNSAGVVEAVRSAAGSAIRSATVRLVPSGDDVGFVQSITPAEYADVDLTTVREVPFSVTFVASVTQTFEPQYFRFDLLLSVDGAVIRRLPVRVVVPGAG